jgi:hypothetical protein
MLMQVLCAGDHVSNDELEVVLAPLLSLSLQSAAPYIMYAAVCWHHT